METTDKEPTGFERISGVTDEQIAAAIEEATMSHSERSAAAMAEPEEKAPEKPTVDVGEVWSRAIEDDFDLLDREDELEEVARLYGLGEAQDEEDALVNLQVARAHLDHADQQAELAGLLRKQAGEATIESLIEAEDAADTMRALDALADRVPIDWPEFAEAFELAEGLDPAGAMAFAAMLRQAEEAEQAELHNAKRAAIDKQAEATIRALLAEKKRLEPALSDPKVREAAVKLAENAVAPGSPDQAAEQVRLVVGGAQEVARLDRTSAFFDEFDKVTAGRIPLDSQREEVLAETTAMRPEADTSFIDRPSPSEALEQFDALWDQTFSRSRELRDGIDQVAARVRADAKEKR